MGRIIWARMHIAICQLRIAKCTTMVCRLPAANTLATWHVVALRDTPSQQTDLRQWPAPTSSSEIASLGAVAPVPLSQP